jgi:hypothetical protein
VAFRGTLVALVAAFADLFLMDALGGIDDHQRLDKLCDLAHLATFVVVAGRWSGLERAIALALFAYRMLGEGCSRSPASAPALPSAERSGRAPGWARARRPFVGDQFSASWACAGGLARDHRPLISGPGGSP